MQLLPQPQHETLHQMRASQDTQEFKTIYRSRAGIEGTISQGVRAFEMRRTRYIGIAKTALQNIATAAAIDVSRYWDFLCGYTPIQEHLSPFAALAPASA